MNIADPLFIAVAIPAVLITGISKGGFGGGIGMIGTPLLALAVAPVKAAAIMLPVLILMDMIGLWSYRGKTHWPVIRMMIPTAILGIGIGWLTASRVSDDWTRILVGTIAVAFGIHQALKDYLARPAASENRFKAAFWGSIAGFTSFISHTGGPPFQAYAVPLKLDRIVYAGTSVIFFSIVNAVKLVPYFALGQFTTENLAASLVLMPLAALGVLAGIWLVRRVSQGMFYYVTYAAMIAVGIKLVSDGLPGVL